MKTDVLLVNMPFAALYRPSIGLSLLKGKLNRLRIDSQILYFTIPMAERIGIDRYIPKHRVCERDSNICHGLHGV